jgi:hypothetical protein
MENITNYLKGCEALGLKKLELFDTTDLYDEKNKDMVCIFLYLCDDFNATSVSLSFSLLLSIFSFVSHISHLIFHISPYFYQNTEVTSSIA